MKRVLLITFCFCITSMSQALTIISSPGGLSKAITQTGVTLSTVAELTITGKLDARDFETMNTSLEALKVLDLSAVTIVEDSSNYANAIPNSAFYSKSSLTSVILPSTITFIGGGAFWDCTGLTSIIIPSSVTSIGYQTFYGCTGLSTFTFPSSVTSIEKGAFQNCTGLTSIYVHITTPINLSSSTEIFVNVDTTTCKLYVPAASYSLYQIADVWKDFTTIVGM